MGHYNAGAEGGADMETLLQLLHNSGSGDGMASGGSGGGDADVINLVSMLFDFILEDRNLPETMKALIARLQAPMVRIALVDPELFERDSHPARRLLNELAGAAMIWSGDASACKDPLYKQMDATVSRVQNEFSDDVAVLESVLDEFTAFMRKDQRRRELVERRLREAEEGRARDEVARRAVSAVIERTVADHDIPGGIQDFLNSGWYRVLKSYHLREGEGGPGWQHQCDLTERLVWTLDPQPWVRSTRPTLLREIPRVVSGLREGLSAIDWDPVDIDKWLHELELKHVDVLQQLKAAPDGGADDTGMAEASSGAVENTDDAFSVAPDLNVGAWVEWRPHEGKAVRCKLAAVIRATGKYIFVNRNGARVVEYMQAEVARALGDGTLEPLDDCMIFDRALESVIGSLRESKAG
nr:DUF1631 family protein [Halospina denitrificans]